MFEGRNVLITGGANGVGKAIAIKFYNANANVFIVDKDEAALDKLRCYPTLNTICTDLGNWESAKEAIGKALPVHHLINNVGIGPLVDFKDSTSSQIDEMFNINFKTPYNVSQVFAKGVETHKIEGATIVTISSVADKIWLPGATNYCCSKAALTMLTKCMAAELAPLNIRSNCIRPGGMNTGMLETSLKNEKFCARNNLIGQRAIGNRALEPSDVADLVLYLSSPSSSMINGEDIAMDGCVSFT